MENESERYPKSEQNVTDASINSQPVATPFASWAQWVHHDSDSRLLLRIKLNSPVRNDSHTLDVDGLSAEMGGNRFHCDIERASCHAEVGPASLPPQASIPPLAHSTTLLCSELLPLVDPPHTALGPRSPACTFASAFGSGLNQLWSWFLTHFGVKSLRIFETL